MLNIFFDFDGTLIDARKRLYRLFQDLVKESNLSEDTYWALKRDRKNHEFILKHIFYWPDDKIAFFKNRWLEAIELKRYIDLDVLKPHVCDVLAELQKTSKLYLVTARQDEAMLEYELCRFTIKSFFLKVLVTGLQVSKSALIEQSFSNMESGFFIGDTGYDIKTGKALKLSTIAVTDGFLSGEKLREYDPDFLVDSLTAIPKIIGGSI